MRYLFLDIESCNERNQQKRKEKSSCISNNNIRGNNYMMFLEFLSKVKPQGEIIKSSLNGKSICISISVEIERITKHDKKNSYRVKKNYIELTHSLFEDNSSLLIE